MAKWRSRILFIVLFAFSVCFSQKGTGRTVQGEWLIELQVDGHVIPFYLTIDSDSLNPHVSIRTGEEQIWAERAEVKGDSLFVQLLIFNTSLKALITSDSTLTGAFIDYSRSGKYYIPLSGSKGKRQRFNRLAAASVEVSGRWEVYFSPGKNDAGVAIGEFRQDGNYVEGTFLTPTGDMRFLEGLVSGDSLYLSGFDGSHALLFEARIAGDSIFGQFWSGKHWQEAWEGVRNEAAILPNPETLTFLNSGYETFDFSFPDLNGKMISLSDSTFDDRVVIVQIMGSWCPNCMDETSFLVNLHKKYQANGLEIIALAFERKAEEPSALGNLNRLRNHFDIQYPILLAGNASKKEAAEKLPMLNHVMSFPTTVFLDRKGNVRRIHTGFSGPSTGQHYHDFVFNTDQFVAELIDEKPVR